MQTSSSFIRFSKWVLVMVILVIIAGAIVRTTQSGMGCPDWPKCFGQYIPPTKMEQVLFGPNKNYTKGQFIRYNDSLWFATEKFTSTATFDKTNWQHYSKHGYTKIVIYQTWIEYINRLLGALLGIFILIQLVWSFKFWKTNRKIIWLCLVNLLFTGFQAWLGKRVVDANLATVKITTHMLVALLIAVLAYSVITILQQKQKWVNKKVKYISLIALLLLIVQIVLGTQVREQVDEISKSLAYGGREQWIDKLDMLFYIHRSFSLVLAGICGYLFFLVKKENNSWANKLMIASVGSEISLGIIMAYASMPAFAQPLHLLFSTLLFLSLFAQWINAKA